MTDVPSWPGCWPWTRLGSAGLVRVEANHATPIGRALDLGAAGVIVPLVNSADDAAAAVAAARYPPRGIRSYGPLRSDLRIGPTPAEVDDTVLVLAMIETADGLTNLEEIAATPGLDGVYVGPSDLSIGLGAAYPGDPAIADSFTRRLGADPGGVRTREDHRRHPHAQRGGSGAAGWPRGSPWPRSLMTSGTWWTVPATTWRSPGIPPRRRLIAGRRAADDECQTSTFSNQTWAYGLSL